MPDAILRFMQRWSIVRYFKEEKFDHGERGKSTPIEVLDGIDTIIRSRLNDFHITTVQNLACANPIMLFVETPYGIYQMLDWVAQAQLCASVGADALFELWAIGVRTIFDLERVALFDEIRDDKLLQSIEKILFPAGSGSADQPWKSDLIVSSIKMRIDSAYTLRLRQIVNCVADQLGGDGSRFLRNVAFPSSTRP